MKLKLDRINDDGTSTLGKMSIDGEFECFTIEDTFREKKVQGETRIPAGTYEVKFRTEGTWYSRNKAFGFGHGILELQDVPGFTYILIHWGNFHTDTEGCILVGEGHATHEDTHMVTKSRIAYKRFYEKVAEALMCEQVFIEVSE